MLSGTAQRTVIEQLLHDFGNYRNQTANVQRLRSQGRPVPGHVDPTKQSGKKLVIAFGAMVEFLSPKQIDPRWWLYTLFKSRKFLFAPKPENFCSVKHLPRYYAIMGAATAHPMRVKQDELQRQADRREAAVDYDKNRDLTYGAETLKARYTAAGEYERCMDQLQTATLGFHPASRVCTACPAAQACQEKLVAIAGQGVVAVRAAYAAARAVVTNAS